MSEESKDEIRDVDKLERVEKKLDRILELLETDCKKMSDHIDFVENVYDTIKSPFNYLMNGIKGVMNTNMITS